ncbi:MAG: CHAT domain-containing protein [Geodermatophilaceae bacterium]|nr:CHAT domain-containing protein [Geodermatophilaceae bacterium]
MEGEEAADLLARADAAYLRVDADPAGFGSAAAALVLESRQVGHSEALVAALRAEAWAERARLDDTQARKLLNEAAGLARRHRLDERLGEVLVTRAAVNLELGRVTAARRDLDAAANLVAGDAARQRDLQQAALHQNTGRLSLAAGIYLRLLAHADLAIEVRCKVANNLALIEARRRSFDSALRLLEEAARAAAHVGPALTAYVVHNRGWVHVQAGRLPEGLRLFDQAALLHQAAGLPLGELYTSYADAFADLRLLPEAATAAALAAGEFASTGVPLMGADAQLRVAQLALLSGDPTGSMAAAGLATRMFRQQHRPAWAARAALVTVEAQLIRCEAGPAELRIARRAAGVLQELGIRSEAAHAHLVAGRLAIALDRRPAALQSLQLAAAAAHRAPVLVRLDGRIATALTAQLGGRDQDVLRHCRDGLRDLARHRRALPSTELRALASGHGVELGRIGLAVSLRSGSPARVLDWMERTRAASLSAVEPPALDGLEDEMAALRAVHAELADARNAAPDEQTALLGRQRDIESRIRRATWVRRPGAVIGQDSIGPAQLRAALGGRVLVEYGVLDGDLFVVVLDARRSRLVSLGAVSVVEKQAQSLMFALHRLTRPRTGAPLAAARTSADFGLGRLAELLLVPLGLDADARLVVVPGRGLHRLPWAALHDGPVSLAPSASFWSRTMTATGDPEGPTVLVAGPDLPGAAREIEAVRRLYADPVVLAPPDSTAGAVARAIAGAGLAHLACHGDLRADNPTFSALRMSDGPLTLHELDSRGAAPRRIVLASCESGAQVDYAGEEVIGFVGSLMARGTAGLLASTVVVSDTETVELMCGVHESLRAGASLADALHQSRGAIGREDPRAFVSWCAFNAYGSA